MKKSTWILAIYGIGILFLINSAITDFQAKAYWALFMDLEFIGFALFMIFLYPKRKLKLNQDMATFVMIHFSAYALMSLSEEAYVLALISALVPIGILSVRLYQRKHKYRFYLK